MVKDFEAKLSEYAHLLVEVGLNVQPGQTPSIESNIEYAALTRLCVAACFDCGARNVAPHFGDDFTTRESFLRADAAVFEEYPSYMKARIDWYLEHKCPRLSFTGSNPELLKGVDPARIQARRKASSGPTKPYFDAMMANRFQWCVGAHPTPAWAEKVFPGKKGEEAVDALWDAIFSVCRITGDGKAVERWRQVADTIAREWSGAMEATARGEVRDFVAVGDVEIKVIGADNQFIDTQVPVRQILEQIVAKTGLPPFLLGLSWSTTERMSRQQADILTTELESYRNILTPVAERVCRMALDLRGLPGAVAVDWQSISLQDETEQAQARLTNAQAALIEQQLTERSE